MAQKNDVCWWLIVDNDVKTRQYPTIMATIAIEKETPTVCQITGYCWFIAGFWWLTMVYNGHLLVFDGSLPIFCRLMACASSLVPPGRRGILGASHAKACTSASASAEGRTASSTCWAAGDRSLNFHNAGCLTGRLVPGGSVVPCFWSISRRFGMPQG